MSLRPALAPSEWTLGLYRYPAQRPPDLFADFFRTAADFFREIDVAPTYLGADAEGFSSQAVKFSGPAAQRLISTGFPSVSALTIGANPPGSGKSFYDRFAVACLLAGPTGEVLSAITINDGIIPFAGDKFRAAVRRFCRDQPWSFGFAVHDQVSRPTDLHVLALNTGNLSSAEEAALNRWYDAPPAERQRKLRDVYPLNLVNEAQLGQPVSPSETLEEFIRADAKFGFEKQGHLSWWEVPESYVPAVQKKLRGSSALIG